MVPKDRSLLTAIRPQDGGRVGDHSPLGDKEEEELSCRKPFRAVRAHLRLADYTPGCLRCQARFVGTNRVS
jgi:hypothetical protein